MNPQNKPMKNPTSALKRPILFLLTLLCAAIARVQIVHAATITVPEHWRRHGDPRELSGRSRLRDALAAANAAGGDTINFSVTGTITLTSGKSPWLGA